MLSWAAAAVLIVAVVVFIVGLPGLASPLMIALATGILLPAWAAWLGYAIGSRGPAQRTRAAEVP